MEKQRDSLVYEHTKYMQTTSAVYQLIIKTLISEVLRYQGFPEYNNYMFIIYIMIQRIFKQL